MLTHHRAPLFDCDENVAHLRCAIARARSEAPFDVVAACVLPDHIHFIWTLPDGDSNYSKRVGRLKVLFTRMLPKVKTRPSLEDYSRRKHRESSVWQRRFWESRIRSEQDFSRCLDYVHRNPVKHGLVSCPHLWPYSSFQKWVTRGRYSNSWACQCDHYQLEQIAAKSV